MNIYLEKAGKRFNRDWIFRNLSFNFETGKFYAITGSNGSGKSTLLQVLAGSMAISEGILTYQHTNAAGTKTDNDTVFKYVSIVAPYLEVIEEMTATEFLLFHASFKPFLPGLTIEEILKIIGLENAAGKQIRFYSSGMKQRIKLAQAVFADAPLLLLDEPCTNFDAAGYQLYQMLIPKYCQHKLVIVSSNDINEYSFCGEKINIQDYKQ